MTILYGVLILWAVALLGGIIVEKRGKTALAQYGTMRYVTHTQTYMKKA